MQTYKKERRKKIDFQAEWMSAKKSCHDSLSNGLWTKVTSSFLSAQSNLLQLSREMEYNYGHICRAHKSRIYEY